MPRATIAEIRATSEFQKTYEWYFTFLRKPTVINIDADRFDMQCISTEKPKKESKAEQFMMRGEQIFDIGIYKVSGKLKLVFLETVDGIIHQMFADWENALATRQDTFNNLTGDFRLAEMDNQDTDNWEYWVLWAFPENFEVGNLDSGQGGAPPMQMGFDLCYTDYITQPVTA